MLIAVALGIMCLAGVPWIVLALGVALWVSPPVAAAVIAVVVIVQRVRTKQDAGDTDSEANLLRSLAASVVAGSTLRSAIARSPSVLVTSRVRRLCALGAPMRSIGTAMESTLAISGSSFAVLAEVSDITGGSPVGALHLLARNADSERNLRRERSVAAAQARFSSLVVGVVPIAIAVAVLALRGVPDPGGALVVIPMVAGGLMMAAGSSIVLIMSTGSRP